MWKTRVGVDGILRIDYLQVLLTGATVLIAYYCILSEY